MCGIVGFITTETKTGEAARSSFFKQALIIDTLRGDDSTGMYLVGHEPAFEDGTPYWYKQLGTGAEFVQSREYWESCFDVAAYRACVGHNRAATSGSVDADNAHPFQEGPITLVHNGTLTTTSGLPNPMAGLPDVEVDSHAICHNLAVNSVEDVIAKLHGAFALVWHDARDDSINVVRNDKRPLHFGLGQNGKTLFFMSEGGMLHMISERLKLGIEQIYYPDEGQWMKWKKDTPLDRPITKDLDLYSDPWVGVGGYHYNSQYRSRYGGYYDSYGAYDTSSAQADYYDDDYDDYPFGGGAKSSGKAPAHDPRQDYILVGGRKKPVPMLLQEAMLKFDVVTEDRLRFTPTSAGLNPYDDSMNYITGTLEGKHKAILYCCHGPTVSGLTDRDWTVRVIGVKIGVTGEPWFICRLVSTFVNPAVMTSTKPKHRLAYDMVPGPDGLLIPPNEFYAAVVDGCVMCSAPIGIMDAYDLIWTSDGPICPNCDDRLYEPRSYQ